MNEIISGVSLDMELISGWFEHLHAAPELSMKEEKTAAFIAQTLRSFGAYEVVEGVGGNGIVASLKLGNSAKCIGLRADIDALPIQEVNNLPYKSQVSGVSHLCGHDGHTTMLLSAAKHLAERRNFDGTVRLIFQPGEETNQGAAAMIEDGLFERFPVDRVFGLHNMPGLKKGVFYFTEGNTMAAVDAWTVEIVGIGGHGAFPELAIDPIVAGSSLVMALQTVVSRNLSPLSAAVVTVGAFQSGAASNVISNKATLQLSIRTTSPESRKVVLDNVRRLIVRQCEAFGCTAKIQSGDPGAVLVNDLDETRKASQIAQSVFGKDQVITDGPSYLGSEDFAFMLQQRKGTYCFIGNGDTKFLHHPEYVLDKEILLKGAAYWVALTEGYLPGKTYSQAA